MIKVTAVQNRFNYESEMLTPLLGFALDRIHYSRFALTIRSLRSYLRPSSGLCSCVSAHAKFRAEILTRNSKFLG